LIAIVDYGLGNIQAFLDIYYRLGIPARTATSADVLVGAEKIILPGVGAFDWAMQRLNASGMREILDCLVLEQGRPVLGVCVGMQMMAGSSAEGSLPGLNWIPGRVEKFAAGTLGRGLSIPHMGWNDVQPVNAGGLFREIDDPKYYFLHSYYFCPDSADSVMATTEYGQSFASAIRKGAIFGTQFHPEKSHHWGVQLLKNFAEV
jgi:glutamine amidotransferase